MVWIINYRLLLRSICILSTASSVNNILRQVNNLLHIDRKLNVISYTQQQCHQKPVNPMDKNRPKCLLLANSDRHLDLTEEYCYFLRYLLFTNGRWVTKDTLYLIRNTSTIFVNTRNNFPNNGGKSRVTIRQQIALSVLIETSRPNNNNNNNHSHSNNNNTKFVFTCL